MPVTEASGKPEVSVLIPARNEEASLGACLESLVSQAGVEFEFIVVNDHSTDRTVEIAASFPGTRLGGQRKRVGLAQVLIRDPKILLMDEPFGPLDAQTRQIMGNLLLDLWSGDRKAVLFVTHDLEEAIALSDRVVIMSAGPAARVIGDWRVPLARPRDIGEIKLDNAFHELHRDIWHMLKAEVIKGYALTEGA